MKTKTYDPKSIEQQWYQHWEQQNYFAPSNHGPSYCIMLPPPNVTGTLHMGHGFQQSLMDILVRYHRMRGYNTLWQLGTDHAGIATQMVVENLVRAEGSDRHTLGREAFVARIWDWKNYSGNTIAAQERRLGISGDWTREKFTLDPNLALAVQQVFIKLYDEGLIYRGQRLVNWDPILHTAISDLEVINEECEGSLWYLRYQVADSSESLIVATTRPETLFGDMAVAVAPDDLRYQHLIGKSVKLPLTERVIPIIADPYVDKEFGTGCVKITPAHDFNDHAVALRHGLASLNIFTHSAKLNDQVPKAYQGLDRLVARTKVVEELQATGLLVRVEKYSLKVPKGDRSGAIIEPYLTDQWFVKASVLAQPALAAVKAGEIKFIPESWSKTYVQWLENIEDWCISRQLWWGHRIPAWFDDNGKVYVGESEEAVRAKYQLGTLALKQDEDVLDTWFSSALWPFSTLGWPHATEELQSFYPTSVLVTGFDIIFFWVARMVMMGLKFTGMVPFKEVYITGLVRDSRGQKMSKSKGNVLDPVDLIDGITLPDLIKKRTANLMQEHLAEIIAKQTQAEFPQGIPGFGADALRFTFSALATTSRDLNFDLARLEGYRNFCTKLWNATRFVLLQVADFSYQTAEYELSLADRWIISEWQNTLATIEAEFQTYRFDLITQALYDFVWYKFCDWYLELAKPILTATDLSIQLKNGTRHTLLMVLESLLRALHPLMPFITEELWHEVAPKLGNLGPTIMLEPYPQSEAALIDQAALVDMGWLQNVIIALRNIRGEMNIAPSKALKLLVSKGTSEDTQRLVTYEPYLKTLAKLDSLSFVAPGAQLPLVATALVGELELYVAIAGLVDVAAEVARLTKELTKLTGEIARAEAKLQNPSYVTKAPAAVVAKERTNLAEHQKILTKLQTTIQLLKGGANY